MDPFSELRKHAGSNHPHKAKLNVVLSAITEVIYERRAAGNGDPQRERPVSSTEYFAALMTALEAASGAHRQELTQLLALALPAVPAPVLRAKFPAVAASLTRVITEADGEAALLRSASACLGLALLAQEPSAAAWARPEPLRAFQLLLALSMDPRPKIRKAGHKWAADVLALHAAHQCDALSTHMASFSENVLASATAGKDDARLVLLIAFLKTALPLLQRRVVSSLVDALAKFASSPVKNLRLVTLEALSALATAASSPLTQDALAKILSIVLAADGDAAQEPEAAAHAVRTLEAALVRLHALNEPLAREMLPRVVGAICAHLETPSAPVQRQCARSLLVVLSQCVPPHELAAQATSTSVARALSSLESLLTLRFQGAWRHVLPLLADLFAFYGETSLPALAPLLKTSGELYEAAAQTPGSSAGTSEQLAKVASAAAAAVGPRRFLDVLPIDDAADVVREQRLWLLPLFKESLKGFPCELDFFASAMLPLARRCEAKTREESVTPLAAKKFQMLSMQIWGLFPSFCANAVDIDTKFKSIAKVLANAMADKRYPELRLTVCQGLQALVRKTRAVKARRASRGDADDADDENDEDEDEYYDEDEDEDEQVDEEKLARDRAALGKYASRYLPLLVTFVEELDAEKDADSAQTLLDTVEGFASLAEASFVGDLFKKIMQKLLEATTAAKKLDASASASGDATSGGAKAAGKKAQQLKRAAHAEMSLAMALVGHMDAESVALLYRVIKPYLLDDTDTAMQKRSYGVLVAICDAHPSFMASEANLQDMTSAICESLLTCSVPAKKMRLRVLVHLIDAMAGVDGAHAKELVPSLVGEIMLCTKEANGKAREAAFALLVAMARLMRAKDPSGGLMEYLQMVLGGLAARTPHMRSASVLCLSRLVFEFGREDATVQRAMPQLLKTVLLLLHEKAREVIKSVIGFMKLGIAMLSPEQLEPFLPDMINGLLVWIGESKNRFRAKTRIILIKLCRKYGYERVAALVPEEDRALIRHIKKTKEREDKKKAELVAQRADKKAASFAAFMADSDDEGDEGEDLDTAAQAVLKRKKELHKKKKVIREDEHDIVDFLDANAAVKNIYAAGDEDMSEGEDEEFETSKDGRLIIPGPAEEQADSDSDDEDAIKQDVASQLERMGLHGKEKPGGGKRKRGAEDLGKEYRSKKAGGDMKKKGKLDPYAYIPLDPKLMAKRNKRSAVSRYGGSVGKRKGVRK